MFQKDLVELKDKNPTRKIGQLLDYLFINYLLVQFSVEKSITPNIYKIKATARNTLLN